MVTTALAGVAGVFSPVWLGIAGLGADVAVGYAVAVVEFLASVPWAQLNIQISSFVMAAIYLIVIGGAVAIWAKTKHNFRAVSVVD